MICPVVSQRFPPSIRRALDAFLFSNSGLKVVWSRRPSSRARRGWKSRGRISMYWLCHATPSASWCSGQRGDLTGRADGHVPSPRETTIGLAGLLAFLNACQTAEATEQGSVHGCPSGGPDSAGSSPPRTRLPRRLVACSASNSWRGSSRRARRSARCSRILRSKRMPLGLLVRDLLPAVDQGPGPGGRHGRFLREIFLVFFNGSAGVALGGASRSASCPR